MRHEIAAQDVTALRNTSMRQFATNRSSPLHIFIIVSYPIVLHLDSRCSCITGNVYCVFWRRVFFSSILLRLHLSCLGMPRVYSRNERAGTCSIRCRDLLFYKCTKNRQVPSLWADFLIRFAKLFRPADPFLPQRLSIAPSFKPYDKPISPQ